MLLQIAEPGQTPLPHADVLPQDIAVGIDLGTTYSVVAVARQGHVEVLPLGHLVSSRAHPDDGEKNANNAFSNLVPSVFARDAQGHTYIGLDALAWRKSQEDVLGRSLPSGAVVISSIKRWMGRGSDDLTTHATAIAQTGLPLIAHASGDIRVEVGDQAMRPLEISAEILKFLRQQAEVYLGKPVRRAVITVPAYFDDAARTATRDAARLAGIDVLRLLNEPTAAAVAYGLDHQKEGLYAVYDLGGGTFDVSLLELRRGVLQVLATGGDTSLGGDDIDLALAQLIMDRAGWSMVDDPAATAAALRQQDILHQARHAKEALAHESQVTVPVKGPKGEIANVAIDRTDLANICAPLIARTLDCCARALADARVKISQIHGIVLVGGSTRLLCVRDAIAAWFGRPPMTHLNPDEAVACGAAIQAEALTSGSSNLLLDVTPLTIGIEMLGGVVDVMIPRNTPIPTVQRQTFTTFQNGQTAMALHIVQGEREIAALCRSLAKFELRGIPPLPAGGARVDVTLTLDADGLLTVEARETSTGVRQTIAVKPSYGLTDEELIGLLEDAVRHHHDDQALRRSIATRVQGMRLLIAVGEALADDGDLLTPSERLRIDDAIDQVNRALQKDAPEMTEQAMRALEAASEPFAIKRIDKALAKAAAQAPLISPESNRAHEGVRGDTVPLLEDKAMQPLDPAVQMGHSRTVYASTLLKTDEER